MLRALRRSLLALAPAIAACNSIVGFGDLEKVKRAADVDEEERRPDGGAAPARDGGEAGPDAPGPPARCDLASPFDPPTRLPGTVNSAGFEVAPSLTSDELEIVFQRSIDGELGALVSATRASTDEPFGQPVELTALAAGFDGVQQPTMTADGLVLVYVGLGGVDGDLFTASRATRASPFGARRAFVEVNSASSESFPAFTPDGAELWLSVQDQVGDPRHLFRSVRDTVGLYGASTAVSELTSAEAEAGVAFSADGLVVYFGSERAGGKGGSDIWTARRSSMTAAFGAPSLVAELNAAGDDYPGWLSTDGCRLYFASDREGTADLWIASRKP